MRTGALYPEVSHDGKTLVYVGYTSYGHDLYSMELDPARFIEAAPYVDTRPDMPASLPVAGSEESWPSVITARHPYNPLPTLRPRSWDFNYGPGSFGTALSLTTSAGDVVGHHAHCCIVARRNRARRSASGPSAMRTDGSPSIFAWALTAY